MFSCPNIKFFVQVFRLKSIVVYIVCTRKVRERRVEAQVAFVVSIALLTI